jgi:hypothetical protein
MHTFLSIKLAFVSTWSIT